MAIHKNDLIPLNKRQLLQLYSDVMNELRRRKLTRTNNNPVADCAEKEAIRAPALAASPAPWDAAKYPEDSQDFD